MLQLRGLWLCIASVRGLKLWSSQACPYAQRARIALEECGAAYEMCEVDLSAKSAEFVAAYEAANPGGRAKVPVLEADGVTLTESLVVVEYVADTLWPQSLTAEERALGRLASQVSPFTGYLDVLRSRNDPIQLADAVSQFGSKLAHFESFLAAHAAGDGPFLFKDFSFAEAALAPFVARCCLFLQFFRRRRRPTCLPDTKSPANPRLCHRLPRATLASSDLTPG